VADPARVGPRRIAHLGFVLPFVVVMAGLLVLPLAQGFWLSLHEVDALSGEAVWVGLDNYRALFEDPQFVGALRNTLVFVLITVPAFVGVGLALALALNQPGRAAAALRALFFGASVLSVTIVTLVWRLVFMTDRGLLAQVMRTLGLDPVNPLIEPALALPAVGLVTVWWIIGLPMMLFLAALQQIPAEVYEAAALDHAGPWQRLRAITLPALGRTIGVVVAIEVILQFQLFGQVQLMTLGGPDNRSRPLVLYIYEAGFQQWAVGLAAAASMLLFVLMLAAVALQMRLTTPREDRT
jgi:multiple sugar transport system permease protein